MMLSLPNPQYPINLKASWLVAVPLGPCWLFYHLIFRQLDLKLHKAYTDSGVQVNAVTTHRHQTIHRTNFVETRRTYKIRYAYQPPGEDSIFHMDYVEVSEAQFSQRVFPVLVLPGQPGSGIPKSNVRWESQRCNSTFIAVMNVLSVFWTIFLVWLCAADDCKNELGHSYCETCQTCQVDLEAIGYAVLIATVVGLIGSVCYFYGEKKKISGRVAFQSFPRSAQSVPAQRGPIPMANVVAMLDAGAEDDHSDPSRTGRAPVVAQASPTTSSRAAATYVEAIAEGSGAHHVHAPEAKVIELV